MYAGLKNMRGYGRFLESDDECVRRLYVEATGHEPPVARHAAMATQFEYGLRKCRSKQMKAAILSVTMDNSRQLVAA